jgi:hypothetical protein
MLRAAAKRIDIRCLNFFCIPGLPVNHGRDALVIDAGSIVASTVSVKPCERL